MAWARRTGVARSRRGRWGAVASFAFVLVGGSAAPVLANPDADEERGASDVGRAGVQPAEAPGGGAAPAGAGASGEPVSGLDDAEEAVVGESERTRLVVELTPYAWLTSYSGDVTARGLPVDVDLSFGDIVEETDTVVGIFGAVEARYGRLVFQFNGTYSEAEASESRTAALPGPGNTTIAVGAELEFENTWIEALAGYRVLDRAFGQNPAGRFSLDAYGGVRFTGIGLDQRLTAQADVTLPSGDVLQGGVERGFEDDRSWFEPFVGLRGTLNLDSNWSIVVRGDYGGFDADDSQSAWQAVGAVAYRWNFEGWSLALFGGYRALGQDYDDGQGFSWDVVTHGPVLGLNASLVF